MLVPEANVYAVLFSSLHRSVGAAGERGQTTFHCRIQLAFRVGQRSTSCCQLCSIRVALT